MAYTAAEVEPLAQRLVQLLPGLDIRLARVWIKSESGVGNNPLGVTHTGPQGKSVLSTYGSRLEGIEAAAALVKRSSNYAGIRASLAGGNLRQQALAIIASPWNRRGSPYYTRVFTAAGFLGGTPPPVTGGPSYQPPPSGGGTPATGQNAIQMSLTRWLATTGTSSSSKITGPQVDAFLAVFKKESGIDISGEFPKASLIGKTWADAFGILGGMSGPPDDPLAFVNDVPTAINSAVGSITTIAAMLAALAIVALGVFIYSKGGGKEATGAPA